MDFIQREAIMVCVVLESRCGMTEPNEQQIALMRKYRLNPNDCKVLFETKDKLVVIHRRGFRRTIVKEIEE